MDALDNADTASPKSVQRSTAPTIHDVAAAAGVSPMTVSRALRGGKNVRPEKVLAVLEAVAALGYHRNENARSIRPGQRTGLIGVIITNVANPYYAQLQLGAEEVLAGGGIRMLAGNSGEDAEREKTLVHDFVGRQVDGLIVVPSGTGSEHLETEQIGGVPLVLASRQLEGLAADTVLIDDVAGAYEGTRRLVAEGHERIAYVGNIMSIFTSRRRLDGFRRAHTSAGLPLDPALIRVGQNDPDAARRAMLELLEVPDPPTAVFSENNRNTVGVIRALSERRVPTDRMRVMGFDDFELSDMMPFPLTVIDHDARELGRTAARMVVERLDSDVPDPPPRTVQLPTTLLD
ncbi:LacI family DNA-binding transcriptional regulator [Glycomyces arizonensis]|uniref:LacI family DNA-binding transcriptional regulator n=1 Tax=Glycomyces arizonensis TaxID=256035 RepID=UPI0003FB6A24|nr:LacI family DNA-binding transcriptional regulator [Glycomyces arizonensis]